MLSKSAVRIYSVKHHLYNQFFANIKNKDVSFVHHISPNLKYIYVQNIKDYNNIKTSNDTIEQKNIKEFFSSKKKFHSLDYSFINVYSHKFQLNIVEVPEIFHRDKYQECKIETSVNQSELFYRWYFSINNNSNETNFCYVCESKDNNLIDIDIFDASICFLSNLIPSDHFKKQSGSFLTIDYDKLFKQ